MKIDHDYIKEIVDFAIKHENPTFTIDDFKNVGIDINDPIFEFHMRLFLDKQLIQRDDGGSGFGLKKSCNGEFSWSVLHLRLTSLGHDFAEAVQNDTVWAKIKAKLPGAALTNLVGVSFALAEEYAKIQLGIN